MFKRVATMAAVASIAFAGTTFAAPEVGPVVKHVVTSQIDSKDVDIIDPDFGPGPANFEHQLGDVYGDRGDEKIGDDVFGPKPTPQDIVKAIVFNKIEDAHGGANHPIPDIFAAEDVGIPTFVWIEAFLEALDPYIDADTDANRPTVDGVDTDFRAIKVIRAVKGYMDPNLTSCGTEAREAMEPELDPRTQFCVNRSISQAETVLAECEASNGSFCYKSGAEVLFEDMSGCFSAPAP